MPRIRLPIETLYNGILAGKRNFLAKAITLVESALDSDRELAMQLIEKITPHCGNSFRIGVTGVPGVGKSSFIESFGNFILEEETNQVAVLAVDPSSAVSGGSILGDKTRMETLANHPRAYVRPSASAGHFGGVAARTREVILLCEAAGFNHIIIETVGVGQSETTIAHLADFFLLLMLAGAGDELQGIKRGITEMCDALVINKADGDELIRAQQAANEYRQALHYFRRSTSDWIPEVTICSALEKTGLDMIKLTLDTFLNQVKTNGFFEHNRLIQNQYWFEKELNNYIQHELFKRGEIRDAVENAKKESLIMQQDPGVLAFKTALNIFQQKKNN